MADMKITVVIPVYNGEKYIAQCIENVLCQTYKDIEIIVVNDGSTDRTAEIAAEFPVKLVNQQNRGPSAARNRGIKEATGDYIHFMDVDDYINRDYYKAMVGAIDGTGAEIAFGSYLDEAKEGLSLLFDDCVVLTNLEDKVFVTRVALCGYSWRYLISRSLLESAGLEFPEGRLIEDMRFSMEAVRLARRIVTVPGAIYHYKKRDGSLLNSRKKQLTKKIREDLGAAKAIRREFFAQHDLGSLVRPLERFEYKLFGAIPVWSKVVFNNGKTKLYLMGIMIMQKKVAKI
jgi:glycosyltransferase involved in cell wall biosynthesis